MRILTVGMSRILPTFTVDSDGTRYGDMPAVSFCQLMALIKMHAPHSELFDRMAILGSMQDINFKEVYSINRRLFEKAAITCGLYP